MITFKHVFKVTEHFLVNQGNYVRCLLGMLLISLSGTTSKAETKVMTHLLNNVKRQNARGYVLSFTTVCQL